MAAPFKSSKTPSVDSSIGLVLRLNNLWMMADTAHLGGNIDHWNYVLDSIYDNLSYSTDVDVKKDESGKVIDVRFVSDNEKIYNFYNIKIAEAKLLKQDAIARKDKKTYILAKNDLFFTIRNKDKWLRTFMHKLGLYLKEFDNNLGAAMFGGK